MKRFKPTSMKLKILVTLFLAFSFAGVSQQEERTLIKGRVVVETDELEGITVFNSSSNRGTTTDEKGEFEIRVKENDVLEFGALQFQDFSATISKDVVLSKRMTVYLIEEVNKLDEVVILPYELSGELNIDIESVRTFNPDMNAIYFGIKHSDEYEFSDDYKTSVENIAMHSQSQPIITNGLNVGNLIGAMIKPLFGKKKGKEQKKYDVPAVPVNRLKEYYSAKFLTDNFNIPEDKIDDFVAYAESNGLDYSLLQAGKEIEFLEFLSQKSQLFLKLQNEKD
ncbi:carboxypeptidase-like regulatory domain-containing protein [Winogradskyella sp. 3972H.M.0a.05]|uniref:carboxypeptidase-like regulatory domain-containing protein n=1 Tax=Winogradskyella sp. 3972H.M.0a.05 TaxID=2950277 RepID=UPI00339B0C7D